MSPPKRKPFFADSIGYRELTFPDTGEEMGWAIDRLARTARTSPEWQLDNDGMPAHRVRLTVLEYDEHALVRIGFSCNGVEGAISARPDPGSGYLLIAAEIDGVEQFRAYMDHPWEEYELYPPGDETPPRDEGPGRMSKHLWWMSLSALAWPVLRPLTENDWFNAQVPDR